MIAGHLKKDAVGGKVSPFELNVPKPASGPPGCPDVQYASGPRVGRPGTEGLNENVISASSSGDIDNMPQPAGSGPYD